MIRNSEFRSVCLAVLLMSAVFFATVLYVPQFMEKILGYSALKAGRRHGADARELRDRRVHRRPAIRAVRRQADDHRRAPSRSRSGRSCSRWSTPDSSYGSLVAGLVVTGVGAGLFIPSVTTAGVTALDPSRASLAGGLIYMFQIAGGAIGLGHHHGDLHDHLRERARRRRRPPRAPASPTTRSAVMHGALAGTDSGQAALAQVPATAHDKIVAAVSDSFAVGIQAGFRFVTAAAVLGFLISLFFVGRPAGRPRAARGRRVAPRGVDATGARACLGPVARDPGYLRLASPRSSK